MGLACGRIELYHLARLGHLEGRANMANSYEAALDRELAHELHEDEGEFEWETHESGAEGEGILGAIGNVLGGLLGEGEGEEESQEFEQHEMHELHELHEGAYETGEQFFGRIARRIGGFVKRAAPILKRIAKVAAPMVGTAIGGPFGAILGKVASSALGEAAHEQHELHELHELHEQHEFEGEGEEEFETHEATHEAAHEVAHEIAYHETTQHEALAEVMAEAAVMEQHEGEAEAMAGA